MRAIVADHHDVASQRGTDAIWVVVKGRHPRTAVCCSRRRPRSSHRGNRTAADLDLTHATAAPVRDKQRVAACERDAARVVEPGICADTIGAGACGARHSTAVHADEGRHSPVRHAHLANALAIVFARVQHRLICTQRQPLNAVELRTCACAICRSGARLSSQGRHDSARNHHLADRIASALSDVHDASVRSGDHAGRGIELRLHPHAVTVTAAGARTCGRCTQPKMGRQRTHANRAEEITARQSTGISRELSCDPPPAIVVTALLPTSILRSVP